MGQDLSLNKNYTEYKIKEFEGYSCWQIVQGQKDHIYIASSEGVLEYDGFKTKLITKDLVRTPIIKSLALADSGKVYFNMLFNLGKATPDSDGNFSLKNMGRSNNQMYSALNKAFFYEGKVHFFHDSTLVIGDNLTLVKPIKRYYSPFLYRNELYAYQNETGLMVLRGEQWHKTNVKTLSPVHNSCFGELFNSIVALTPTGFHRFSDSTSNWTSFKDIPIIAGKITDFTECTPDMLAISTDQGELLFLSKEGLFLKKLVMQRESPIRDLLVDSMGSLWVAHSNGVSLIPIHYPMVSLESQDEAPINSAIHSIAFNNNNLFFVAKDKFFIQSIRNNLPPKKIDLQQTRDMPHLHVDDIQFIDGDIVINQATGVSVYNEKQNRLNTIFNRQAELFIPLSDNKTLLFTTLDRELVFLKKHNEKWTTRFVPVADSILFYTLQYFWDKERKSLWTLKEGTNKIVKLTISESNDGLLITSIDNFNISGFLIQPLTKFHFFTSGDKIAVATNQGVYSFDQIKNHFELDTALTKFFGKKQYSHVKKDVYGNLWLLRKNESAMLVNEDGEYTRIEIPIPNLNKEILSLCSLPNEQIVIGTQHGMVKLSIAEIRSMRENLKAYIRSVQAIRSDSTTEMLTGISPISSMSYSQQTTRFVFCSNHYFNPETTRYQYRLLGWDDTWSAWTKSQEKDFTSLREGEYTFEIRAKDSFGNISSSASYKFSITPPLYRTWWAYTGYLLGVGLIIVGIVHWRTHVADIRNQELEIVVSERTEEIRAQKETIELQATELEHVVELKTKFLTDTAHELRTPLTLTLAPIYEALERSDSLPEDIASKLKLAERNGSKLLNLINEIITVSKLDKASLPIQSSHAFPNYVLFDLTECYKPFLIDKHLSIQYNLLTPHDLCLELDWSKYRKIVSNLLHNAIKFTPSGGEITLTTTTEQDESGNLIFETAVLDTGEGIEPNDLTKIFERFYQKEKESEEGFGIGLALIKDLVDLINGTIEVSSEPEKGSCFTLRLPAKVVLGSIDANERNDQKLSAGPAFEFANVLLPLDERKARLLLVEDNAEMRDYLRDILQKRFVVYEKYNGAEALQWLEFNYADVIVSDWMMPVMNGLEFYTLFKKSEKNKKIPFVFLTAKADYESRLEALMIGVDEYIQKPFAPRELLVRIERLLHLKRMRVEEKVLAVADDKPEEFSLQEKFLQKFKDYVEKNVGEDVIKITDLCDVMAVSERQLHYKIKSLTGATPANLVKEIKLQHVRRLLEKNMVGTVAEATYAVGFGNITHFSKLFEQRFGKKPSTYFKKTERI